MVGLSSKTLFAIGAAYFGREIKSYFFEFLGMFSFMIFFPIELSLDIYIEHALTLNSENT
jgi:hypothetical protein